MLIACPFICILSISTHNWIPLQQINTTTWLSLLYLVAIGSCTAFVAFIYSMKHLPPAIASLYAYFNPIVAMIIGSIMLNEYLTIEIILGTLITLVGVYLVNRSFKTK